MHNKEILLPKKKSTVCHIVNDDGEDDSKGEVDIDVISGSTIVHSAEPYISLWMCMPEHFLQSKLFDNDSNAQPVRKEITTRKDSASKLNDIFSLLAPDLSTACHLVNDNEESRKETIIKHPGTSLPTSTHLLSLFGKGTCQENIVFTPSINSTL